MFSWFKKRAVEPRRPEGNPGQGTSFSVGFSGAASRTERLDLVELLSSALTGHGIAHRRVDEGWLALGDGLTLRPEFLALAPREDGSVQTSTTISAWHATALPEGLFEYQHAADDTAARSIASGFDAWIRVDLKTLKEALQRELSDCTSLEMGFPGSAGTAPFKRRVVLGPTMHYAVATDQSAEAEEHPFCPCCLFTRSFDAFKPQIEGDGFFGLRLFASRDADGVVEADCRVNGIDWPAGAAALVRYVDTWPQRGFEFRKQFVVIQAQPGA